jgi:hypothetical protein
MVNLCGKSAPMPTPKLLFCIDDNDALRALYDQEEAELTGLLLNGSLME